MENNEQNIKQSILIDLLEQQFNEFKIIIKDFASKTDIVKQQELIDNHCIRVRALESNTAVAKEILNTTNECIKKFAGQIDYLKEHSITRQQLDRLIEVNQADITENRKKIRDLEIQQATSWTKLSIIWAGITILGIAAINFIIDIFKKHL